MRGTDRRKTVLGPFFAALLIASTTGLNWACAETAPPPLPPPAPQRGVVPREPAGPPPYEAQLDRLAELMGTLAFMQTLCGQGDGATWHDKMESLLDAESKTGLRKERLAGSYNRGYRGYQVTYRTCTPAAQAVVDRSLQEGERLARDLSIRFGGE
ncbi:TIGR02301 family protein [Lichenihabitans sp. PAMC28606]|uniref:TIGR02301 family protein n=1 Tax=Lichenihabitans sp. PAMC28606 TaxID=2880932 RepID=UPI001D0BE148|nr:TIGR02301 family protein [Lichenihabitans sp. PAMC28606]UDL94948.1 TIGR02301 family protein [Lichenihabitans sp. PAMC28606]